jgi:Fe-S cluster assembly protein SufD
MTSNSSKIITYIDNIPSHLSLVVNPNEEMHLELASFSLMKNAIIDVDVYENASFIGAYADFSTGSFAFNVNVHLKGEGASCLWKLASLSKNADKKVFEPSVYHEVGHASALMSNYGIVRDSSSLIFAGESVIKKGSIKSSTRQEAKIIVFDKDGSGRASPILRIGDNDVLASHSASIGRLNEEHLFYLESRGLSHEEAKRLITLGYLKPIEDYFSDSNIKNRIDMAIEGGI